MLDCGRDSLSGLTIDTRNNQIISLSCAAHDQPMLGTLPGIMTSHIPPCTHQGRYLRAKPNRPPQPLASCMNQGPDGEDERQERKERKEGQILRTRADPVAGPDWHHGPESRLPRWP